MASPHNATITLKGSTAIVVEFFEYAVNSILYQRGIYPAEMFQPKKKYNLTMMVASEEGLVKYMAAVMQQLREWLMHNDLQKLVLVVASVATKEVLERWTFDVQTDKNVETENKPPEKTDAQITMEIQAIIRQITASITFLPLLNETCSFDLLAYTDKESIVPKEWEESDARFIDNAADVKLRSLSTKVHKIDTLVSYKQEGEM